MKLNSKNQLPRVPGYAENVMSPGVVVWWWCGGGVVVFLTDNNTTQQKLF